MLGPDAKGYKTGRRHSDMSHGERERDDPGGARREVSVGGESSELSNVAVQNARDIYGGASTIKSEIVMRDLRAWVYARTMNV